MLNIEVEFNGYEEDIINLNLEVNKLYVSNGFLFVEKDNENFPKKVGKIGNINYLKVDKLRNINYLKVESFNKEEDNKMEFTFSEKQVIKEVVKKEIASKNSIYNKQTLKNIKDKVKREG